MIAWTNEGKALRRESGACWACCDKLLVESPFPTWCLVWDWGLYSPLPTLAACHHLIHPAEVEWLISSMNLEAEGGHSLSIPFFLISFESKFDSTYLALSIVLSYAVSLMINAYNGQYIQFWGSEGNHVLYVISVTNKVMCMRVCVWGGVGGLFSNCLNPLF